MIYQTKAKTIPFQFTLRFYLS